jgi:mycofactocin precursor
MADPTTDTITGTTAETDEQPLVEADLLVEDVSIDGMCGVY